MKFTCTQENLLTGLGYAVPVAGRNTQLPILANILLEASKGVLRLTTTDLTVGVKAIVGGKVEAEGVCAVPARQLLEYVQQLPTTHPIELQQEKEGLKIVTDRFRATFSTVNTEDFPLLPQVGSQDRLVLQAEELSAGLTSVLFAAAREETRPEIHSVFMRFHQGEMRLAATDSFRLAENIIKIPTTESEAMVLLPLTAAQEIVRLLPGVKEVGVLFQESVVIFQGDGFEFSSRLVEGNYPDYRQIIPATGVATVTLDRAELVRGLKTLAVFLSRDSRRVRVKLAPSEQTLTMRVEGGEVGQSVVEVAVTGEGETTEALFNVQYLLEGLQHMRAQTCAIQFGGAEAPAVFRPVEGKDDQSVYVVMPIQM